MVEKGQVVYKNTRFDDGHVIGSSRLKSIKFVIYTDVLHDYRIDSWGERLLSSYSIRNDDGSYNCSLQLKLFDDPDAAIQHSKELSKEQKMKCIVAQWFADIDRH